MSEIKFRVWDTERKEYSAFTNRDPMLDLSNNRLVFWERAEKGPDIMQTDACERFVLQQYTGFKDIHGKEIYEGDTVKDAEWWVGRAEVKFRDGMFGFEADDRFVPLCELKNIELDNP